MRKTRARNPFSLKPERHVKFQKHRVAGPSTLASKTGGWRTYRDDSWKVMLGRKLTKEDQRELEDLVREDPSFDFQEPDDEVLGDDQTVDL